MNQRKSRVGRRRWAELVRFLTDTMKTSRNERVRMTAALRLADVLTLREQREIAELKAVARSADTGTAVATEQPTEVAEPESAEDAARRFLESRKTKGEALHGE